MRFAILASLLALLAVGNVGRTQDKKADEIVRESSYLEKGWGVKLKAVSRIQIQAGKKVGKRELLQLSFEFEKDLEPKELKELRAIFDPIEVIKGGPRLWFHVFDEGNALIWKSHAELVGREGEISGVKGDVFRVSTASYESEKRKMKKIAVRPPEKPE